MHHWLSVQPWGAERDCCSPWMQKLNGKTVVEIQNHLLERQLPRWRGLPSILSFDINKVSLSYTEISSSVPESVGSRGRSLGTMFQPHHSGFLTTAKHIIFVLALIFPLIIWKTFLVDFWRECWYCLQVIGRICTLWHADSLYGAVTTTVFPGLN